MPDQPPIPARVPHPTTVHGVTRDDDWFWLRERDNPDVLSHLEAENGWMEARTAHTADFREALFEELKARIQEDDSSVPAPRGNWLYYTRTEEGRPYAIHCRRRADDGDREEILVDVNALAEGHDYTRVANVRVSPDHTRLAYAEDHSGAESYVLTVRDLETGDILATVPETYYGLAWSKDSSVVYYTTFDAAHRPDKLWRLPLGGTAEVVLHEPDERFHMEVRNSRSRDLVIVRLITSSTHETHIIDASGQARVVRPRQEGIEYTVEHHGDRLFVATNLDAPNFRLVTAPLSAPSEWSEVIAHRDDATIEDIDTFVDHLVVWERRTGLPTIRVRQLSTGEEHIVAFDEAAYALSAGSNLAFDTAVLRFHYDSLVTPDSVYDYDMDARTRTLRKRQPVLGGYEPLRYVTERVWATAPDGVKVPITLVRRRDTALPAPMYLVGYGSYGLNYDPNFSTTRLSLLDRGMVCGIAHIRGGADMGRGWYEDGKLGRKKNTFTDFVACAQHLVDSGVTSPDRLTIQGGSAGGLLMGAVLNMRPDLFHAAVADVPFVDAVNTMLDATIPLTVVEYDEWGNPNDEDVFHYMLGYSPYDNVAAQDYPHILVTAGLNDPRVQYWEPAKWVAKLRTTKTDANELIFKIHMGAGHGGRSGRYGRLHDTAFRYAFLLDKLGLID